MPKIGKKIISWTYGVWVGTSLGAGGTEEAVPAGYFNKALEQIRRRKHNCSSVC